MVLASTAFLETTLILFLHILGAMATMGGVLGLILLYGRARAAADLAELRFAISVLSTFNRAVLQPAAGLTGIIGLVLALRFDGKGIFEFSKQGWMFIAIALWVVLMGVTGRAASAAVAAGQPADREELETVKERLTASPAAALIWVALLLVVVIVYLMVFQPLVLD